MHFVPRVSYVLDKRQIITKGEHKNKHHVKIRVTYSYLKSNEKKWRQVLYKTGVFANQNEFEKLRADRKPDNVTLGKSWSRLRECRADLEKLLDEHRAAPYETIGSMYYGGGGYESVTALFDRYETPTVGTRNIYRVAKASFIEYHKIDSIAYAEVTVKWLNGYVAWGRKKGLSDTYLSMNLRCMRSVMNYAIQIKKLSKDLYPFGRGGFKIVESQGIKKALTEQQKNAILKLKPESDEVKKAADFWIFSYYCYGMNTADIVRLKWRDIEDDMITIYRQKTENTSFIRKKIIIPIHKEAKRVINKWGSRDISPDNYVFPVLDDKMTDKQKFYTKNEFNKEINTHLKTVGELVKVKGLTWYTARHTFATIALQKGATKEFIQEALGHVEMSTTENYLSGFDMETRKRVSASL